MLFNTVDFAVFLPIVLLLYWSVFKNSLRLQNIFIVLVSYFFYACWDWRFLGLIFLSSLVDYTIGLQFNKPLSQKYKKYLLGFSVLFNLGLLFTFKYFNFFIDTFTSVFSFFGTQMQPTSISIILPVGISFYTFQTLSYTIDLYKEKITPTKNIVAFFAFVSFFPQLVAGPIERASRLLPQFANPISIATVTYSNTVYTHQGWFTEDHRYFILGDEIDEINLGFNTRSIVFDFQDLDNPELHFEYEGPTAATDHNGYVKDGIYYLANYTAGVRMIDISGIDNQDFQETGFFDVYPNGNNAGYNGAWNVYPYFESGTLLVTTLRYSDENFVPGMLLIRDSNLAGSDINTIEVSMYPNPASETLTIEAPNQDVFKVSIFDMAGKKLFQTEQTSALMTIDVSSFSRGVYFVTLNDTLTKKLIIQ